MTDTDVHDGKGKGEQSVKQRYFDGLQRCNQCGEYSISEESSREIARTNSSNVVHVCGTSVKNKGGAHGHKRVDCPVKTVAHLDSESVIEPNEEPTGIESLEWLLRIGT